MKLSKAWRIINAAAIAAAVSSAAVADDSGWYLGANAGQSLSRIDNGRIEAGLAESGLSTVSIEDAERHFAYKLFGGYQFNRYLLLEGGYFDLGKFGFSAQTFPQGMLRGELKLQGANFDVVGTLPIARRFAVFGRAGLNYADVRDSFEGSGSVDVLEPRETKHEVNYKVGLGVQYDLTQFLRLRGEVERYRIDDPVEGKADVDLFSIGLAYRFGTRTAIAIGRPPPSPAAEPAPVVVPVVTPDQQYCTILDIEFEINRDEIQREDKERLGVVGTFMNKYPQTTAVIEGHTDNVGTPDANMTLSKDRAESVVRYLEENFSVSASRLKAVGYGDTRPRGDN